MNITGLDLAIVIVPIGIFLAVLFLVSRRPLPPNEPHNPQRS